MPSSEYSDLRAASMARLSAMFVVSVRLGGERLEETSGRMRFHPKTWERFGGPGLEQVWRGRSLMVPSDGLGTQSPSRAEKLSRLVSMEAHVVREVNNNIGEAASRKIRTLRRQREGCGTHIVFTPRPYTTGCVMLLGWREFAGVRKVRLPNLVAICGLQRLSMKILHQSAAGHIRSTC